ncbi:MAG: MG2 domain-containing protein, partial [Candidatus Aminicenantaceae bacterium]
MKKKLPILFILLGALLLLSLLSCKKKEEKRPETTEMTPVGDLHVLHVSPKGQTSAPHEAETIVVIFDQPMVPLEALPEKEGPSFLKLDPSFSGKHRWMGTRTLAFTPDKRFPYATEIKAAIPAGTQSLKGYTLKKDFTWSFSTIRPRLVSHSPQHKQEWIKLDSQILLIFNQPVIHKKVEEFLSLVGVSKEDEETSLDFKITSPSAKQLKEEKIKASPDEVLLLIPEEKLKTDYTYFIGLKSGLPGKEGTLGMEKSRLFLFKTFKAFTFEKMESIKNHNPRDPLKFQFSNPVVYKNFVERIRFQPEVLIPDYYSSWEYGNSTLWVTLPLEPESEYTLFIEPELEDEFGNKLGKQIELAFSTSAYSPSVSMTTGHGIVEAYGDLRYPFFALNTQEVSFHGANIKKEDVIPLLTTKKIFWSDQKFYKKNFFQVEKVLKLEVPRNKKLIFPINLKELLPEKYGFLFLQLDTQLKEKWNRYPKAFLQVTDLGISAKFSPDNNLIWVTELKTGLPVSEAEVEIRDDFNKVQWRGKTDSQGISKTPGWKPLGIQSKDKWIKPRQWVFVKRGKDIVFTSSEWGTGISPYRFGINYDWNPQPIKIQGYIFTERGIYRAGEKVHIKGIIRNSERGEWKLPSIKSIECEVHDPFQKKIYKDKIELDSYGSFSLDLDISEEASLGVYQIMAKISQEPQGEKSTTVHGSFRVEAFRPAEFEVNLRTSKESYVFGDEYKATIRADYLFGGPMAGQKASWHLRLNPSYYTPPGHKGYIFGNQIDEWDWEESEKSRLLTSGEATLDARGKLELKAKLIPEKEKDSAYATLEATVVGPSRRSISNRIQTIVHRGSYYIGLKPSTIFLKKGDELKVNTITVDPEGSFVPERKISIKLLKREWHSVRKAGIGGRFRWISEREDKEIDVRQVQSKNEPVQITFNPEKSGFYLLSATGKDKKGNTITTTTYFYVTGKDYVPWKREDDDTVELVTDSENYKPGDVARILVKSPYEITKALVSIEREFIVNSHVVNLQGSSNEIEIPIISDYIPNVFISVLLVQGRTSPKVADQNEDIGKPSFKIGYVKLNVDPSEKRLAIDIQKDKQSYRPRDKVTVNLKVKDLKGAGTQASISLAAVDLGVLNLIGYKTPNPFSLFYRQKPLSVQTSETRLHVLGQREYGEKGEDVGGGVGERIKAAYAPSITEIELRGDFKSTAYWNPSVLTDEDGNASVSFKLPDNLTTFRIMAVAQTKDSRFGRAESNFKVSKPLLLQAALPRFARLGDSFKGGVVVQNFSSKKGDVIVSCEAKGIHMPEKNTDVRISLNPGEGKEVLFPFEAKKAGKAVFTFRARMEEETDGLEITLPLKKPRPTETVALFNHTTESTEEKIRIPENIFPSESKIEVQAASTALSGLKGCVDYLTDYPYLCLEQRLSSVLPYIVAYDVILDFKLSKFDAKEMQIFVKDSIKEIYNYQKANGGFGLWPESTYESPFLTCYTTFALAKARDAGFNVNKQVMEKAVTYLKNLLRGRLEKQNYPYISRTWKTIQAFALYNLALLNQPEPSYAEKLYEETENLSLFGKTLLLKALNQGKGSLQAQNTLLEDLMNKIKVTPSKAHFEDDEGRGGGWIYSSNTRTSAFVLQSMIELGYDHPLLPAVARWLVEKRKTAHWRSTHENFYVFYALNDFYRKYEKVEPDFKVEVRLAGKLLLEEIFKAKRDKIVKTEVSLAKFE